MERLCCKIPSPLPEDVKNDAIANWNNNGLRRIPKNLDPFLNCSVLQAQENNFLYVHIRLKQLSNLVFLDMSRNSFTVVPVAIFGLPCLQHLDLSHNKLLSAECNFPAWLNTIRTVVLDKNCISDLPSWWIQAPNLLNFSICHNKLQINDKISIERFKILSDFYSVIPHKANVQVLKLTNCGLQELPLWLTVLNKPTELHLDNAMQPLGLQCSLEGQQSARNTIFEMKDLQSYLKSSLEILNLRNMGLTKLPDELDHLINLKVLILRKNKLSFLPNSFAKLRRLEVCDISECCLMDLPQEMGELTKLTTLHLSKNKISYLPKSMNLLASLTLLDVYWNCLDTFPFALLALPKLAKLDVELNLFESTQIANEQHSSLYISKRNCLRTELPEVRVFGPAYFDMNYRILTSEKEQKVPSTYETENIKKDDHHVMPLKRWEFEENDLEGKNGDNSLVNNRTLQNRSDDEDWSTPSEFESDDYWDSQHYKNGALSIQYDWMKAERLLVMRNTLPKYSYLPTEPGKFDNWESSSDENEDDFERA